MSGLKNQPLFGETAYTLRHKRTSTYSFPKANRFREVKHQTGPEYLALPSTLNRRGTSQGYGKRWKPGAFGRNATPAPGTYEIPSSFELKTGLSFKKEPVKRNTETGEGSPGPGSYEISQELGKNAPKFSFRQRLLSSRNAETPAPCAYFPRSKQSAAYTKISFGIGEKGFGTSIKINIPGPGSYDIPSDFKPTVKT